MALRFAILGLLNYHDLTGYELKKMFDDSIRNFWHASMSQIYRELNTLEEKGHVSSVIQPQQDRPDKRVYSITAAGKTAFKEWITHFPEKLSKEKRDEFSLRLFFGSNLSKEALITQFERLIEEKTQQLDDVSRFLSLTGYYTQKLALFGGEEMYWKFILRRAAMNLNTTIEWAQECIEELER
jgi:DNA-binding PadR family transcriptional regulator